MTAVICSTSKINVFKWRALIFAVLLTFTTIKITKMYCSLLKSSKAERPDIQIDNPLVREKAENLLALLHRDLFLWDNITDCDRFKECSPKRVAALRSACESGDADLSIEYKGKHKTSFYYNYDIEICSGDEVNPLDSMTFNVPTDKALEMETEGRTRILRVDDPLVRLHSYYDSLKSGMGYLYLGEEIVYRFRTVHEESSTFRRLLNIYKARLAMLWGGGGESNPYVDPIGPTFGEFMAFVTELDSTKPKAVASTVRNCLACQIEYDVVLRHKSEVRCLGADFTPNEEYEELTSEAKTEAYNSFKDMPSWILAQIYEIYYPDLETFTC